MDRRIRILYLIGSLQLGGAQKHLIEVLRRINRKNFVLYLAVLIRDGSLMTEVSSLDVSVYCLSIRNRLYHPKTLFRVLRFAAFLRREKIDVIHSYLFESGVVGLAAGMLARVPLRMTSRRSMLFLRNRPLEMLLSRVLHIWCHKVVAVCEAVRQEAITKEWLPPSKVVTIHNGVDAERLRDSGAKCADLVALKDGKTMIGMIATLKPIKDTRTFLKALEILARTHDSWIAILIGDGPLRPVLETEVKELGLSGRVVFAGQRDDIRNVIQVLDVSVLSSKSEGMSNTLLESMAAGKPVIATNVGGNPEVVEDGLTGLLVPVSDPDALAEAMRQILEDKEKAAKMGQTAREKIEKTFLIEDMVNRMEALYKALLTHNVNGQAWGD